MKSVVLAAALIAIPVVSASAADMPLKAAPIPYVSYNWTGFYIGGNVGYGWGHLDKTNVNGNAPFPAGTTSTVDANGGLGGLQGGLNYEFSSGWVVGVEGQYSWSHIDGSDTRFSAVPGFTTTRLSTANDNINSIATVTGRVGHAFNNWLLYVKGGGAWARAGNNSNSVNPALGNLLLNTSTASSNRSGWTVGLGAEWGFWQNWSARIEYDYMDFGTTTVSDSVTYFNGAAGLNPLLRNVNMNVSVIEAGLNYRFNLMH